MKKIFARIKSQMPKEINGFECIKTQELYIPYFEVGLECLVRDISNLNLLFEMILKLIEINVNDINEISEVLGVSFEIIKEAIVDMVAGEYLSVSENILKIKPKGKEALRTRRVIETRKKNINKILVDLITGDIYDGISRYMINPSKSSLCLDNAITASKSFFDANYSNINRVYQEQQENDSAFGKSGITKELYKIVDIYYNQLVYEKNIVRIYKRDNSEEVQLQMQTDKTEKYLDCLYKQLRDGIHPCLENFFEKDNGFINRSAYTQNPPDNILKGAKHRIEAEFRTKENLNDIDINLFRTKRYSIIDNEYENYFIHSDEMVFDRLFIYTNRIKSILSKEIFLEIIRLIERKRVIIIYDKDEYRVTDTLQHFFKNSISNKNLMLVPSEGIDRTYIYFESCLLIRIQEYIIKAFGKPISYKASIIDFELTDKSDYLKEIAAKYNAEGMECDL